MKKQLLLLGMASVFALTGCHGTKKVSYKEFGEAVSELKDDFTAKEVKVSGKIEDQKFKSFTVVIDNMEESTKDLDENQTKALAYAIVTVEVAELYAYLTVAYVAKGDEGLANYTLYVGNGFKVKYEDKEQKVSGRYVYEKHGLLVHEAGVDKDGKKSDISLSWKIEEKK